MNTTITTEQPQAAEPRPWRRRPLVWLAAAAFLTAIGLGLGLALGLHGGPAGAAGVVQGGPAGAAGVVQGDGYRITMTLTADQTRAKLAADHSQDGQVAASMIDGDAAAGIKGSHEEAAVRLSATGKALITALLPQLQNSGYTTRVVGEYLVVAGPASTFAENGGPFGSLGGGK